MHGRSRAQLIWLVSCDSPMGRRRARGTEAEQGAPRRCIYVHALDRAGGRAPLNHRTGEPERAPVRVGSACCNVGDGYGAHATVPAAAAAALFVRRRRAVAAKIASWALCGVAVRQGNKGKDESSPADCRDRISTGQGRLCARPAGRS